MVIRLSHHYSTNNMTEFGVALFLTTNIMELRIIQSETIQFPLVRIIRMRLVYSQHLQIHIYLEIWKQVQQQEQIQTTSFITILFLMLHMVYISFVLLLPQPL